MYKVYTVLKVTVLAAILLFVPMIGSWVSNRFNFNSIDSDGSFMWISVHHITQMLIILLLMVVIQKFKPVDFYLGFGDEKVGFKWLKWFFIFFSIYTIIAFTVIILSGGFGAFQYPLTFRNITGYLGFQLLLSGPSEEIV